MFEERTGTLLCSDLLGQIGDGPAIARGDIVGPALEAENVWHSMSVTRETAPTIRRLAALEPKTLAIMHGSSLNGGCAAALRSFADGIVQQTPRRRCLKKGDAPLHIREGTRPLQKSFYCFSFSRNIATAHW